MTPPDRRDKISAATEPMVCGCGQAPDAAPGAAGCSPTCMLPEPPAELSEVEGQALAAFWSTLNNAATARFPDDDGEALERVAPWVLTAARMGLEAAVAAALSAARIETCTVDDGGPCGQPAIAVATRRQASAFVCAMDLPLIEREGYEITPLPTLPDRDAVVAARVRAQVAGEVRQIAERVRESAWTPSVGIALGSVVDDIAAQIAAGVPSAGPTDRDDLGEAG